MSDEEQEQTIAEDLVVTKYKMGGDIANRKFMEMNICDWIRRSFRPVVQPANVCLPTAAAAAAMWFNIRGTRMLSNPAS